VILHEALVDSLAPGSYVLRAFVRDSTGYAFGGALVEIQLPRVEGGTVGPIVRRDRNPVVRTELPARNREGRAVRSMTNAIELASLPIGERALRGGEPLRFATWICFPVAEKDTLFTARRWITRGDAALFRFDDAAVARAGDCASLEDALDTTPLAPGDYVYHLRRDGAEGRTEEIESPFTIAP
jgi:hypothetical protein